MYAEMKLALFIYLWYPKTKVKSFFFFFKSFSYLLFVRRSNFSDVEFALSFSLYRGLELYMKAY